jgi:peptidoglycan/LPS O-acetylase OafA/YrhL
MEYKPKLDGLRCIAILMVLIGHFLYFLGGTNPGIYGVNLFFVLSGFLITSILLNETGTDIVVSYQNFLGRRALRIFPIYYLLITCFVSLDLDAIKSDLFFLYTYTYNFHVSGLANWERHIYAPYWSLSVEEQYYLFFPILILLLNRRPNLQLIILFMIILVALTERIFRLTGVHHYVNLIPNMWALGIGSIGAWFRYHDKLNTTIFKSVWIELLMLLALCLVFHMGENLKGFIFYPLINIFFVIKAACFDFATKPINNFLSSKWAIFIGRISYGIYLYHIMVLHFFTDYVFNPLWNKIPFSSLGFFAKLQFNATLIKFPFVTLLTILLAYLSFRYIESPILKLKNEYFVVA